jgi:hypothetical protein
LCYVNVFIPLFADESILPTSPSAFFKGAKFPTDLMAVFAGYVNISVGEINNRQMCERWYSVSSAVVGRSSRDTRLEIASVRIKARYQSVSILPLILYQSLVEVSCDLSRGFMKYQAEGKLSSLRIYIQTVKSCFSFIGINSSKMTLTSVVVYILCICNPNAASFSRHRGINWSVSKLKTFKRTMC